MLKIAKNVLNGNLVVLWGGKICNSGLHRKKVIGVIRHKHTKTWKLITLDGKHYTETKDFPTGVFTYGEVDINVKT